jgi:hypothetical protein
MTKLEMVRFGRTLTDREYGKSIAGTILKEQAFPVLLDFRGVISLGSSCGDEILSAVGAKQEGKVTVTGTNQPVRSCLEKVAEDLKIRIEFT